MVVNTTTISSLRETSAERKQSVDIYLVRHCEYEDKKNIIPGRLPGFPLSFAGRQCAQELGSYFRDKKINGIYTSPITRTKETAAIIAKILKLQPKTSSLCIEIKSPLQGQSKALINAFAKAIYRHPDYFGHGGETMTAIFTRMSHLVKTLLGSFAGKNLIIVSHGDPIMMLVYGLVDKNPEKYLLRKRPYIPMGGITQFTFTDNKLEDFKQLNY